MRRGKSALTATLVLLLLVLAFALPTQPQNKSTMSYVTASPEKLYGRR